MAPAPLLFLLVPLLVLGPVGGPGAPPLHHLPTAGDTFSFQETIAVGAGYGNYSGYSESDAVNGTLTIDAVASNGTVSASYDYAQHYRNSTGASISWTSAGTFTFSDATYLYLHGTDNQSGFNGTPTWFYVNNTLGVGQSVDPLGTPLTISSRSYDYALQTAAGNFVTTIAASGSGTYERVDSYGQFDAVYQYSAFYDPSTGYIVGYQYLEHDTNPRGDGFVYTDNLRVTHTSFALTTGVTPSTYALTVTESGLGSTTPWTVYLNGIPTSGLGATIVVGGLANGSYLAYVTARGYTPTPLSWSVTIGGSDQASSVQLASTSGGATPSGAILTFVLLAVILALIVAVVAVLVTRRAHRGLRAHSAGGIPQYAGPVGAAPPPISLIPGDQPRVQQVVLKEVVKVKCAYCGSLIDSTAPTCPFCGATRS